MSNQTELMRGQIGHSCRHSIYYFDKWVSSMKAEISQPPILFELICFAYHTKFNSKISIPKEIWVMLLLPKTDLRKTMSSSSLYIYMSCSHTHTYTQRGKTPPGKKKNQTITGRISLISQDLVCSSTTAVKRKVMSLF